MLKNKVRQSLLDKEKWEQSEKMGEDLSGAMPYCYFCRSQQSEVAEHNVFFFCKISHETREETCACAKAFNRFVSEKRKAKADKEFVEELCKKN